MAGHRQFQSAAECRPVNGDNHRLDAVFDMKQKRQHSSTRSGAGGHLAKFFDVGAGNESTASADDDRCFDRRVSIHFINRCLDRLRHSRTESVNRRIIDGDHRDIIVSSNSYKVVHRRLRKLISGQIVVSAYSAAVLSDLRDLRLCL